MLGYSSLAIASAAFAQADRTVLPPLDKPFAGVIAEKVQDATPAATPALSAPAGAPNVFLFMSDDVGFAMSSAFGGPVPTPNLERLAAQGQRYNRFHTTGICSPSRAALLTGRNHHNTAMGMLADLPSDFPGYNAHIPASTATIAEVLRLNGYNTAMFGKHHNVPPGEAGPMGPYDHWPTGLGFEYFYGFVSGDTDQWNPDLVRGTNEVPPLPVGSPPEVVDSRLAGDAIHWLHTKQLGTPDKPFFIYYAPGSTHAPHQAPADWIARFKGHFDQGWDSMRVDTWRRQLALGVIPKGTILTARPDGIPAWTDLTDTQRQFAIREMETAAAMLAYEDAQLGRVLGELDRMGQSRNTLFVTIIGDNGASGEGGPSGVINELAAVNGIKSDDAALAATLDDIGGPHGTTNYPVGWAWAMNTPLRWVKQYASMLGGIRNGMIVTWDSHVAHPGSICPEFGHLVDIVPTILQATDIPAPTAVDGVRQKPLDGQSLLSSLTSCQPDRPRTQYFEMQGKAGLYHDGWFVSSDNGRKPWEMTASVEPLTKWELYDLRHDFSQAVDVSARYPDRVAEMVKLWREEARRNNVFPIISNRMNSTRTQASARKRSTYEFWGKDISIPAQPDGIGNPTSLAGSFRLQADLQLAGTDASGVVAAAGSRTAGWSLYFDHGRPVFAYARSPLPGDFTRIEAAEALPAGSTSISLDFRSVGPGRAAKVELSAGGKVLTTGTIARTWLMPLAVGEMLDSGRDGGVPVTDYATPNGELQGDISHMSISFSP